MEVPVAQAPPQPLPEAEDDDALLLDDDDSSATEDYLDDSENSDVDANDNNNNNNNMNGQAALVFPRSFQMGMTEAGRMSLGKTERNYALRIKAAIEADPQLNNLSDFFYAQLAIVSLQETRDMREDLPAVMERVEALQSLREEYLVRDTLPHAMQVMTRCITSLLPGWFIAFEWHESKAQYLRVCSIAHFDMSIFRDPLKVQVWLAAVYYINHCHVPDLEAARRGFAQWVECKGYDWRSQSMLNIKAFTEAAPSFALYPMLCSSTIHYHTGMFVKLLTGMVRRMLPSHLTKGFEFEADCEFGDSLHEIFASPCPQVANQRLLQRLESALKRRYDNEANFTLG